MPTSPRLVYTPRTGTQYQPPGLAAGTEVVYSEFNPRHLDGIQWFPELAGMSVCVNTPHRACEIRVADLSVEASA